jgi:uncharacterized protein
MTQIKPRRSARKAPQRLPALAACAALALALAQGAHAQTGPQPKLQTTEITAGMHVIQAELAVSPQQQATGMMMRTEMGANEGMLFVNSDSSTRCFWMKNTLLPLSIAFIGDDGTIVNVAEMQPRSEESHCSVKPARYALEMRQGWFAKRGIKAGMKLRGQVFEK